MKTTVSSGGSGDGSAGDGGIILLMFVRDGGTPYLDRHPT